MNSLTHTYQLLVRHNHQLIPMEVQASCIEEACQIAKNSFRGTHYEFIEPEADADFDNTWLIMRTTPYEYCDKLHIYSWDGERYKTFGKAEPGNDVFSAIQKIAPNLFWQHQSPEQMASLLSPANENRMLKA